jgi:hypothetical protein
VRTSRLEHLFGSWKPCCGKADLLSFGHRSLSIRLRHVASYFRLCPVAEEIEREDAGHVEKKLGKYCLFDIVFYMTYICMDRLAKVVAGNYIYLHVECYVSLHGRHDVHTVSDISTHGMHEAYMNRSAKGLSSLIIIAPGMLNLLSAPHQTVQ